MQKNEEMIHMIWVELKALSKVAKAVDGISENLSYIVQNEYFLGGVDGSTISDTEEYFRAMMMVLEELEVYYNLQLGDFMDGQFWQFSIPLMDMPNLNVNETDIALILEGGHFKGGRC